MVFHSQFDTDKRGAFWIPCGDFARMSKDHITEWIIELNCGIFFIQPIFILKNFMIENFISDTVHIKNHLYPVHQEGSRYKDAV